MPETPASTRTPDSAAALAALASGTPDPLEEGEHVELWLVMPASDPDGADATDPVAEADAMDSGGTYAASAEDADVGQLDIDGWDVRPAQVVTVPQASPTAAGPAFVAIAAGGWDLTGEPGTPSAPGARAIVRRVGPDGIAEWEGAIATGAEEVHGAPHIDARTGSGAGRAGVTGHAEAVLVLRLDDGAGRLYQRRRSPRLAVRLSPVRLVPLPGTLPPAEARRALDEDSDLAPVARLSDVSASGAAIVVDTPLETGTTVAIEFELPGEPAPFSVRGRVVEPAISLHGEAQPQPDGLPGFRRGIEFLSNAAGRESRRLATVVTRLLQRDTSRQ